MPEVFATSRRAFYLLGSTALVVAALYWGQKLLIPFALAILLAFVLAPLVTWLERRRLKRVPAVLLVVSLAFLLLGAAGWAVALEVTGLVDDLPGYTERVRAKIGQLQLARAQGLLRSVQNLLEEIDQASQPTGAAQGKILRVEPALPSLFAQLQAVVGRLLGVLSEALAVLVLVVSMLVYREDLRNRLIRLAGIGHLVLTTRALDEAGQRISRFLIMQLLINVSFGLGLAAGLTLIGVPQPIFWGCLAAALRFVPYVGTWLVGLSLLVFSVAALETGWQLVLVAVLFVGLEILTFNVFEPLLFGHSTGISPVALLIAAAFWMFLWGPIGLILAPPLTACLVVLGRFVPQLEFFSVLLSDQPALKPEAAYYQRLLARDQEEAAAVVRDYLGQHAIDRLYDEVLVPALVLVRRGRQRGKLRPDDEEFILRTTRELLEHLEQSVPLAETPSDGAGRMLILGLPACDEVDELALLMLRHLGRAEGQEVRLTGSGDLSSGMISLVQQEHPVLVFVATVAPGGLAQARYLCQRLHSQFPTLRVVVGRWGHRRDPKKSRKLLLSAGADHFVTTLREACSQLTRLARTPVRLQETS
jgi:predicted PurR-regulated permease PerM